MLVSAVEELGQNDVIDLLHDIHSTPRILNPSKDAVACWSAINRSFVGRGEALEDLWQAEKLATSEAVEIAKAEGLDHLAAEHEAIMRMTREEAVQRLIDTQRLDSRAHTIAGIADNGLMAGS